MTDFDGALMAVWHNWMSALFGSRVNAHVLGAVTWADLALSGALVILILIANATAATIPGSIGTQNFPDETIAEITYSGPAHSSVSSGQVDSHGQALSRP